jgi:vacuolar-type H+-ATPase subunit I/STV1
MRKNGHLLSRVTKQRYYSSRDLQFSIALLVVLALLAGIFLQTVSSALITHYGMSSPLLAVFLAAGYVGIVILIAVFFTYRLVGPFRRLEYEMKLIQSGDLSKRLSVRTKDDLHIRNFVNYVNLFVAGFEGAKKEEDRLRGEILSRIEEIEKELAAGKPDPGHCAELKALISKVREAGSR